MKWISLICQIPKKIQTSNNDIRTIMTDFETHNENILNGMCWFENCLHFGYLDTFQIMLRESIWQTYAVVTLSIHWTNWEIWKRLELWDTSLKNKTMRSSFNEFIWQNQTCSQLTVTLSSSSSHTNTHIYTVAFNSKEFTAQYAEYILECNMPHI